MNYEEAPNYNRVRELFGQVMANHNFKCDYVFDWDNSEPKQK